MRFGGREFFSVSDFSNFKTAQIKGGAGKMKLNVIFVFRTISSIKLQKIHFNIIDFNVSGNQGVTPNIVDLEKEKMDEDAKE